MAKPLSSTILRKAADLIDKSIPALILFQAKLRATPRDGLNDEDIKNRIKAANAEITKLRNEAERLRSRAERQDNPAS
jgi:hypothetical protein